MELLSQTITEHLLHRISGAGLTDPGIFAPAAALTA